MLPRSLNEIYENLRDYAVMVNASAPDTILGCCALHVTWNDLAEIKSLAVSEAAQGRGVGRQLVEHCVAEARELMISRVFALSYKPGFFEKLGFVRIDKEQLPRKIWGECVNCSKFMECDETCLIKQL